MDKPLFSNSKEDDADQTKSKGQDRSPLQAGDDKAVPDAKAAKTPDNNPAQDKSLDLAASAGGANSTLAEQAEKDWDAAGHDKKNVPWMNDPKGRLAVRAFSRGILGATFFVSGGMVSRKWMKGYEKTNGFGKQKNTLQFMAKLIDTVVGVPIEATVKAVTGDAELAKSSVLFRPTFYTKSHMAGDKRLWGRTLGHEVVDITFDFFCASVGDAWGRDIAGFFDPNVKKDWLDDKGHIKFPQAIHDSLSAITRYVTYNGGEDWAVSIPYAFFMKGQRSLINKYSPGWKYDFDQDKRGGSFKVGGNPLLADGKTTDFHYKPTITGNYALESMMDLQSRFTVYNIGTLMFREMYNHVGNKLHGHPDHLYGDPSLPDDPNKSMVSRAGDLAKWAARSAIKGVIIMTPSVPFFWITRSTQSKHRGLFIHAEHGMMTRHDTKDTNGKLLKPVEAAEYYEREDLHGQNVYFSRYDQSLMEQNGRPYARLGPMDSKTANPGTWHDKNNPAAYSGQEFHPYQQKNGLFDNAFNKIGSAQYQMRKRLTPGAKWFDRLNNPMSIGIKKTLGLRPASHWTTENPDTMESATYFTGPFARASISYTPYMYAKTEFANLWDSGKMDMAAERVVDGAAKLNWGEFKSGAGEVWSAILHKPMGDPEREVEAQRRVEVRKDQPDVFTIQQFQSQQKLENKEFKKDESKALKVKRIEEERRKHARSSWQERVVQGKPEDKPEVGANKPKSYAEQEAMRKALEELQPPTNSIN